MKKLVILFLFISLFVSGQSYNGKEIMGIANIGETTLSGVYSVNGNIFRHYISFGGTNEYLNFTEQNIGQTNTINFWYNATASPSPTYNAIGNTGLTTNNIRFVTSSNLITYANNTTSGNISIAAEDANWHMATITTEYYSATHRQVKAYLDGVQQGATLQIANGDFKFQYLARFGSFYSICYMDQLVVYNSVISSGDITNLYGGGTIRTCGNPKSISGRIFYVNFEQAYDGLKAETDDSGTTINLTQNNMEAGDIIAY